MNTGLGRYVFALSTIGFGICGIIWHDHLWQLGPAGKSIHAAILSYCTGIVEIAGGLAIAFPRSARAGATVLAILYGISSVVWLPLWIRNPLVFDALGNFFEQFSMLCGALILYGPKTSRFGYYGFGVSVISFAVYQTVHPDYTATLVPTWIVPGQMFWVIVTTIAFVLAAVALLIGRSALLAARLTTVMLFFFGVLIWFPAVFSKPSLGNWVETCTNFAICGAAWIVADYLAQPRTTERR